MQTYKKTIITFEIATILLIIFIEEYYNQHKFSSLVITLKNLSKLLINNPHNSPHRLQHPKNLQQHQHPVRQATLNHQHVFQFKKTHIHLKKDIHFYHNLSQPKRTTIQTNK